MNDIKIPLELVSSFLSAAIIIAIFFMIFQYKQKLDVLKEFDKLKDMGDLSQEDRAVIKTNLFEYKEKLTKAEALLKLVYPIFITVVALLIFMFSLQEALIYLNVVIVTYIYLHVNRLHLRNFVKFLEDLNK